MKKFKEFINEALYDSYEKKKKFLNTEGNILTFNVPFLLNGQEYSQIINMGLEYDKEGGVRIKGWNMRDTPWYESIDDLILAVDWNSMENWH
jgi:hypothetical protein